MLLLTLASAAAHNAAKGLLHQLEYASVHSISGVQWPKCGPTTASDSGFTQKSHRVKTSGLSEGRQEEQGHVPWHEHATGGDELRPWSAPLESS